MSENILRQIVNDKTQNRYLFVLFLFMLFFGATGFLSLMMIPGYFLITSGNLDRLLTLTFCSCSIYPLTVTIGLGAAWYAYAKKYYALIFVIMLIPLCNFVVAVGANIAGY
ncbi:MAG: hypothetical protein GY797_31305 [Deltaproteobacteria bacterium]|nr:hypothetical protein [Deltaproteobacteria bacterium]